MAKKRVDEENLKRFAENLKTNANILKRETSYNINETVNKGQVVLKCITAGTTDKEAIDISAVSVGDTLIDGTAEWQVKSTTGYGSGDGDGTSVSEWATATSYEIGQIVIYGDSLYRCTTDHTSSTFNGDIANWELMYSDIAEWRDSVYYTEGVTVIHDHKLYQCLTAHTSTSTFDGAKWQIIGDYTTAPIKIGEVGYVSWQYTLMQNHLVLDGSVVSNFQATYPELYDFFDTNSLITTVQADYNANHALLLYDSVNDEATMPDFLDKTVWGGNTVEEKEAGLPNITGSFGSARPRSRNVDATTNPDSLWIYSSGGTLVTDTGVVGPAVTGLDASRFNPIYGNSTTVQPPAIQLIPQIRYTQDYIESACGGTSIEDWETAIDYEVGDYALKYNQIYRCNTAHTSSTFSADISNWDLISGLQVWQANTTYKEDSLLYHEGKLYKVNTSFTSTSIFSDTNLDMVSGGGLVDWQATTNYKEDDIFVYDGQIYRALVGFTSGSTFAEINILNDYTLASWQANTSYTAGEYFEESGVVYEVLNNFTSGATFAVTSDIAVYTPITWASGTNVNVNDLVEDSGNYYIALANFTCGDTFTKVAFEEYVPLPLTETQIEEIVEAFNPAFDGALGFVVQDSAPAHNAVFRSNDLTDYFNSGQMSEEIANGTFRNIFPGDYIIKSVTVNGTTYNDVKWIVGDCDYFYTDGDTECTTHHVLLFPETVIGTAQMNTSNTTSGGYVGSRMWTTTIPLYVTGITNAFGSAHVLQHRELLTTSMDTNGRSSAYCTWGGAANNWAWTNVKVNIFNENMVYGGAQCSSSMFDTGDGNTQIAVMQHHKSYIHTRSNWYWLRSVTTSTNFANCYSSGLANNYYASTSGGLRPYFLLT